jgi:hypothetical protein
MKQSRAEQYIHTKGKTTRAKSVMPGITELEMKPLATRTLGLMSHHMMFVVNEECQYPFCILTLIEDKVGDAIYQATTWFPSLPDLLDYVARYLSSTELEQQPGQPAVL